jgi:predicted phosphoribosyltransferase
MSRFKTREEAGRKLAGILAGYRGRKDAIILGIPKGGVPVAHAAARELKLPFDIVISRKLPLPWDTEAAFGAVAENSVLVQDERFVKSVPKTEISYIIKQIREEVGRRIEVYRGSRALLLEGKVVIIVDDGMAGSWTVAAAAKAVQKLKPKKIIIAMPCASEAAIKAVGDRFEFRVLQRSGDLMFAVSQFYEKFHQLDDDEVMKYLKESHGPLGAVKKILSK